MDDSDGGGAAARGGGGGPVGWFELDDADWYELDDEAAAALTTEADAVFLRVLRERAETSRWSCDPDDTQARHFREAENGGLRLLLILCDDESSSLLITFGLVFDGSRVVGDEVHSQTYEFLAATPAHLEASGSPAELAERAADWFEALSQWPIERHTWGTSSRPYYEEWILMPSVQPIGGMPTGGPRTLSQTRGSRPAAPPDKVVHVRGRRPQHP